MVRTTADRDDVGRCACSTATASGTTSRFRDDLEHERVHTERFDMA
jgi:hypothetical protein